MDNYYGNICYCRRCNGVVHTIKKGDTLYLISKYYKVPIGEIMAANRNINVYNLQIGDEICIPVRRPDVMQDNMGDTMKEETEDTDDAIDTENEADSYSMGGYGEYSEYTEDDGKNGEDTMTVASPVINTGEVKLSEFVKDNDMTIEDFARLMKKFI